jgi:fructokinase
MKYFGGIEAGGTNFICAIGSEDGKILKKTTFQTITPKKTIPEAINFFLNENKSTPLSAIGIACFGPLDLDKNSITYGEITTTPKAGWNHYNIYNAFKNILPIPLGFDTDVNGAALGEHLWGAAKNIDSFIYITVGTGIGVGAMISNSLLHGLIHPEMGHIIIPKCSDDDFSSVCPFHKNCLEGLASGPAMMKRWKVKAATDLEDNHKGWDLEAYYLGIAIANYSLCLSPKKVIIGGGVLKKKHLIDKIRQNVALQLNNYLKHDLIVKDIKNYIVLPKHMGDSGILGSIALAIQALERKNGK